MPLDALTESVFGSLSRLRGKRIFHPFGLGFEATLTPVGNRPTGAAIFDAKDPKRAIVRLSRSAGLPEALPDPCGLAFRVPDAYGPARHQDVLLVSSGVRAVARHLILPARGFADRPYSSLLPYQLGDGHVLIGAVATAPRPGPRLADLAEAERPNLRFRILLAPPGGEWQEVAELELSSRLADQFAEDLRLDPLNSGGGLEPAGFLNRLRRPAYRASQDGRGAPPEPEPGVSSEAPAGSGRARTPRRPASRAG
jgi:hypothetical protein